MVPITEPTAAEATQYLNEMRFSMNIVAAFYGLMFGLQMASGYWLLGLGTWASAEVTFWLASVKPTKHWLQDHRQGGNG